MIKFLPLITALLTIIFTAVVSTPGSPYLIGGMTQADISNMYPSAITPAGITFAIWSLIYLSWVVAGVYVAFFQSKEKISPRTLWFFSMAILLTGIWLVPWGYNMIGIALVIMLILLGALKYAFHHSRDTHIFVRSSIELTLGWINIATVANITIWLISIGFTWGSIPEMYWAIGVLGLALLLTAYYQCRYHAYIISLVFLWTMLGEWIAHPALEQRVAVGIFAFVTMVNMLYSYTKK
jgi:flagellar biosynthesis protein FliQ